MDGQKGSQMSWARIPCVVAPVKLQESPGVVLKRATQTHIPSKYSFLFPLLPFRFPFPFFFLGAGGKFRVDSKNLFFTRTLCGLMPVLSIVLWILYSHGLSQQNTTGWVT